MKAKRISKNIVEIDGERFVKEDSKGWLNIPELGISVEVEVHDKDKSWDELGLKDREKELLTAEQCIWLANSKYAKQLKMDGSSSKDDFFIQQPFNQNRKNGYVVGFSVDSDDADLYCCGDSDYSGSTLGVRFARKILKGSKGKGNK
ncbi:MAG TPA: hypothetical protein ENI22_00615 [Candidatus Pacearchaeota archaeon]|nr:hypothetical protein [Candidatus Pacearchaeota archaeon]